MSSDGERFFSEGKSEQTLRQYSLDTLLHERLMLEQSISEMDDEYNDEERSNRFSPDQHQKWRASNRKARNFKSRALSNVNAAIDHKTDLGKAVFKLVERFFKEFPQAKENEEIIELVDSVYKLTRI